MVRFVEVPPSAWGVTREVLRHVDRIDRDLGW